MSPAEKTEREKMASGEPYLAMVDPTLIRDRLRVRRLIQKYNSMSHHLLPPLRYTQKGGADLLSRLLLAGGR
jgi:hypothetical protein